MRVEDNSVSESSFQVPQERGVFNLHFDPQSNEGISALRALRQANVPFNPVYVAHIEPQLYTGEIDPLRGIGEIVAALPDLIKTLKMKDPSYQGLVFFQLIL